MKQPGMLVLAASVLFAGCSAVLSTQPVGEQPIDLSDGSWDGTWSDTDDFLEVRVLDAQAGRLQAAWIESRNDGFEIEQIEVWLRRGGDATYANVIELEDAGSDSEEDSGDAPALHFAFVRVAREGDRLTLWHPRLEAFKALVEAGELPGAITDSGDVVLGALSEKQLERLSSSDGGELWDWANPGFLVRLETD